MAEESTEETKKINLITVNMENLEEEKIILEADKENIILLREIPLDFSE